MAMSPGEVGYRIHEQVKRALSRRHTSHIVETPLQLLPFPELAEGLGALADERMLIEKWRDLSRSITVGQIEVFGKAWPPEPRLDRWHLDPVTGESWPSRRYCFDIPYRRSTHLGDVKFVWELNRLQYLQPLAALAALEKDRALARFCTLEIEAWIGANPPFRGVNWSSSVELALRAISILVVVTMLEQAGILSIDRGSLSTTIAAHGYWIRRFPSCYSSANNHRIAEAGALFILGCLVSGLPDAKEWLEFGRAALEAEVEAQIYLDGGGAEQSPTYTAFSIEWLLLCGELARHYGRPFPESYWQRLIAAGEFLRWITDAGGRQPRIGDDDECRVICSQLGPELYVSSILSASAVALKRPELAPPKPQADLRQAFFGKPLGGNRGPAGVRHFPVAGYTVARDHHRETQSLMVLDHGPLGYLAIAAHGHADALSLWLHIDDQPVIVDAGTYLYHAEGDWRDHFRSTPAHNTLSLAGRNSSRIAGPFNWSRKARASVCHFVDNTAGWSVEMEHDGFVREFGLRHRRRVERTGHDVYVITDRLLGKTRAAPPVEVGFLLHPDLTIQKRNQDWAICNSVRPLLYVKAEGPLVACVQEGQLDPPRAWYSPRFGERAPTCRLVFQGTLAPHTPFCVTLSILHPTAEAAIGNGARRDIGSEVA